MYKSVFDNFDVIKAPDFIVDKTVKKALLVSNAESCTITNKKHRRVVVTALAACFTFVFVLSLILGVGSEFLSLSSEQNSFVITANAKQVELLGDKVDSSTIGVYSDMLTGGWAMYPNLEKDMDISPNYFQSFALSLFSIEGKDIASVTFKTEKQGTYFAVSPGGYFASYDEVTGDRYTDMSLENSQYSADELKKYSDGLSYGKIYCDTVTFVNIDVNGNCPEKIDFGNKLEFILESNHQIPEMSAKLDRLWECEQEILKFKENAISEGGSVTEEEENLWDEMDMLTLDIRELILGKTEIKLTVTFLDGSSETKVLKTSLVNTDDQRMWLTISE